MNKIYQIIFSILLLSLCNAAFADDDMKTEKFVSVADIHFDPYLECEKLPKPCSVINKLRAASAQDWEKILDKYSVHHAPEYGQDTNYYLLKSTISALGKVNEKEEPDFVLVLGDFLGHLFHEKYIEYTGDKTAAGYQSFVNKTLQFLTIELNKAFPETDVYPAVGNNDSYTADYGIVPKGLFFSDIKTIWARLIKNKANQESFKHDFPVSGYYAITLPEHTTEKIIVLNTVLFSTKAQGPNIKQAAQNQLQWLHKQLSEARKNNQKVILAFHIPADINVSGAFKDNFGVIWKFWQPTYWKEIKKITKQFSNTITVMLPAHIHRDIFQFIMQGSFSKIPVNFTPSISPIFSNDPEFKVFSYELPGFFITNVDTYFNDLSDEKENLWKVGYSVHVPRPEVTQKNMAD